VWTPEHGHRFTGVNFSGIPLRWRRDEHCTAGNPDMTAGRRLAFTVVAHGTCAVELQLQKCGVNIPATAAIYTTPRDNDLDNGRPLAVVVSNTGPSPARGGAHGNTAAVAATLTSSRDPCGYGGHLAPHKQVRPSGGRMHA